MHIILVSLSLLVGIFIYSCSVQVKDAKKSYYSKKVVRKENIKKESIENENIKLYVRSNKTEKIDKTEGEYIKDIISNSLDKQDKDYIQQEAVELNIPIPEDKDIEYFIDYFATTKKYFTENALKRSNYFMPMVKKIFEDEGLPEELSYLAIVESGFNPFATSSANAAGIWQFIPSTGKRFGLRIDEYIDERRDPYKSTMAAAKYLKSLYNMFRSWGLAIAAYNCGEKCISKRLEATSSKDFLDIKDTLPSQTKEYVPRFFAILLIAKNPEKYGLDIKTNVYNVMNFTADREIYLSELVDQYKVDYDILKFYNAHLKKDIAYEGVNINIPNLDYASSFDRRFITVGPIVKIKPKNTQPKEEGEKLNNPFLAILDESKKPEVVKASYNGKNLYKVKKGDTLYSIAKKYGVSLELLKKVNNIEDDYLMEDMELVIP